MKKWQDILITSKELVYVECDCCGKRIDDQMELQECLTHTDIGGYNSIFGDGVEWSIDLCQDCIKKLLGPYIKFKEE